VQTLLPGITARRVPTDRLTVNILEIDGRQGIPVLLVHGNVSSSLFWQPLMLALPERYRPIAIDLRGFGDTDPLPVDATRGVRDYSDDVIAAVRSLELSAVHIIGWSLGGGVVLQYLQDASSDLASVTLVNPVSPFGLAGTRGVDGVVNEPPGIGSGGGTANPGFVALLAAGDRSSDSPLSPRNVLLSQYVKPPFVPEHLDIFVESMLSTRIGDDHYPGDSVAAPEWPGMKAGTRGVVNTIAPNHFRLADLPGVDAKPPILWVRGSDDVIVSDGSLYDLAYLGSKGYVPGWPGGETCSPQPMVGQTRQVLDGYAAAGGRYREVVITDTGHSPFLEKPAEFLAALVETLDGAS
jgi:pimeloyl-ACP methyl ester carboxylesterase